MKYWILITLLWPMTAVMADDAENEVIIRDVWYKASMAEMPVGLIHSVTSRKGTATDATFLTTLSMEASVRRFGQSFSPRFFQQTQYTSTGELLQYHNIEYAEKPRRVTEGEWVETGKLKIRSSDKTLFLESESPICSMHFTEFLLSEVAQTGQGKRLENVLSINFDGTMKLETFVIEVSEISSPSEQIVLKSYDLSKPHEGTLYWFHRGEEQVPFRFESKGFLGCRFERIAPEQIAEIRTQLGSFDIGSSTLIPLYKQDSQAVHPEQLAFELTRDPNVDWFELPTDCRQQVTTISDTIRVVVPQNASRIEQRNEQSIAQIKPSTILASSPEIVQWSHDVVKALKQQHARVTSAMTIQAMRKSLDRQMKSFNFATGFAIASEVAISKQGDCTEYAVLLAALLREQKIPARVGYGLIYSPALKSFSGHMWTEAYCETGWVMVDASQPETYPKAFYIKYGDHSLAENEQPGILEIFNQALAFNAGLSIRLIDSPAETQNEAVTK